MHGVVVMIPLYIGSKSGSGIAKRLKIQLRIRIQGLIHITSIETTLSFPESGPIPEEDRQSGRTVLSVNFFYTDEFEWVTADPEGYVCLGVGQFTIFLNC